jgi:putative transposase
MYRGRFGVEPICRVLGVSASAYYQRKTGKRSQRVVDDERMLALIRALHLANYEAYGSRRMWKALGRAGHQVGRDRVARLMRRAGIQGAKRRTKQWKTTTPDASQRRPDLVQRRFRAAGPDALWVADFTYLRSWQGPVFLSFVIDVWSRRVVGWQCASHMRTTLVLDALRMALSRRRHGADVELVHHSARGSPTWVQGVVATPPCGRDCRWASSASAGVRQPSVFRGRPFSAEATAARSSRECLLRSVPFGKY